MGKSWGFPIDDQPMGCNSSNQFLILFILGLPKEFSSILKGGYPMKFTNHFGSFWHFADAWLGGIQHGYGKLHLVLRAPGSTVLERIQIVQLRLGRSADSRSRYHDSRSSCTEE